MRRLTPIAALLPLLLAACGSPTTSSTSRALDDRVFVSESTGGHSLVKGTRIRLTFKDGRVDAYAGCNHLSGTYALDGGRLSVGSLAATEMGCTPNAKMTQDEWLSSFLTSDPDAVLTGRVLTLSKNGVTLVMSERTIPDRPLKRTRWLLTATINGSGPDATTATVTDLGTRPSMRIVARTVSYETPCNSATGRALVSATTIAFDELAVSTVGCGGRRQEVELIMIDTLRGTTTYSIDGKTLTITSEDGETGLVFRAS